MTHEYIILAVSCLLLAVLFLLWAFTPPALPEVKIKGTVRSTRYIFSHENVAEEEDL